MKKQQKTVLVSGNFNILHPGHLRLLRYARECGDKLIVAVASDKMADKGAHMPENLRIEGVQANSWVDEAFLFDQPIEDLIDHLRPHIVVKGKEHENVYNPELKILESYGGKLLFSSGETIFSSLDLLRKDFLSSEDLSLSVPRQYLERHHIEIQNIQKTLPDFSKIKVCVVGDLIVDEYITCESLGMSQEDPTIVVAPIDSQKFVGGAGIVAAHAAGLGARVCFLTVVGNDETQNFARKNLSNFRVQSHFIVDETRPTSLKQRYRSKGKTLLRVSHLRQNSISNDLQDSMYQSFENLACDCNVLIFSDFNYGCLPQPLVDKMIAYGQLKQMIMLADSQSSSQYGDVGRFLGMDLLTPTEREARISTHIHEEGLITLADALIKRTQTRNLLLKLGEEGVLIYGRDDVDIEFSTDQLEALNHAPKDVAGAGDCMLVATGLSLVSGLSIWESAYLGSIAAGIQVGRVGNKPITLEELSFELERQHRSRALYHREVA